ncbi:MAG: hypothetical protein E7632_05315 [Ruminococcaceae bacterium]|nr:hypothetical protein [Oscillospiraceae bacterium]
MKKILAIVLAVFLLLSPILCVTATAFALPTQYGATFLGELSDKYARLTSVESPKVVLIGGSSMAFGLDSERLEKLVGMPVVNFGLYATLGTKCMMDLAKAGIGDGDIVILAPETDAQTMSLYFNGEAVWQALDSDFSMLRYIDAADYGELAGALWGFAQAKLSYVRENNPPMPDGVYSRESFNEFGDISYKRPFNVMHGDFDPSQPIRFDDALLDEDFIEYVNDFSAWCKSRGAVLYYSFSPMNALAAEADEEAIAAWYGKLAAALDCEICSDVRTYIMEAQYFYDTNFHLNDTGVDLRTRYLAADILRMKGDTRAVSLFAPDAPKRPADYFGTDAPEDTTGYFVYEENGDALTLIGITDDGKKQTELTLPALYQGKPVTTVAAGALDGCTRLKTVIVPEYTALTLIYNGAFGGVSTLREIRMETSCEGITVSDGLMDGTPASCVITVERAYYGDFAGDYFWAGHMNRVKMK